MSLLKSYIQERYPDYAAEDKIQMVMDGYRDEMKRREAHLATIPDTAFMTFSITGDSVFIWDIYVALKARKSNLSKKLSDVAVSKGKEAGCRVLIGFSEFGGGGDVTMGRKAYLAYGLQPVQTTTSKIVYMKGI